MSLASGALWGVARASVPRGAARAAGIATPTPKVPPQVGRKVPRGPRVV